MPTGGSTCYGPCTEYEHLGRTVGTDAGNTPQDPQLRISGGRFALNWHAHSSLSNLTYSFQLAGHAVAGGYVGTFHYHESEAPRLSVRLAPLTGRAAAPAPSWSAHRRESDAAFRRRLEQATRLGR